MVFAKDLNSAQMKGTSMKMKVKEKKKRKKEIKKE